GYECVGYITVTGSKCHELQSGDRVVMAEVGSFRSLTRSDKSRVLKILDNVTSDDASAIAGVGITAYYSLVELAHLQENERVLIHAGAGETGQMANQMAQIVGAEVFATVGSLEKKRTLLEDFGVPSKHIFYSRHIMFAASVM
ncbi:hypothetical protein EV356DRAFT_457532, partial [Viridothelium virens]